MGAIPTQADIARLEARREAIRKLTETMLLEARGAGRTELNEGETARMIQAKADLADLDEDIATAREDCRRGQVPERYAHLGENRARLNSGAQVSPMVFDEAELRELHGRLAKGESGRIEARGFESATPLLPAELYPLPTFPIHENRLLDRLQAYQIDSPSLEYIQVNSTTGAAAVVAEGATKPEIVMNTTQVTIPALTVACHSGVTWQSINDWPTFSDYVRIELMAQIRDVENSQLIYGTGGTTQLNGMLSQSGIIVHDASTDTGTNVTALDSVEKSIALLRAGAALAEPTLFCVNPATWSALRRIKDAYGRFILAADPSRDTTNTLWGIDTLVSTKITAGDGVLIDTTKMGRAAIREVIGIRIGYSGTDLVQNILRSVVEERLNLCVERPSAICWIKNLPLS
jgi:HK97 family phage major capsid protein